MALARQQIELIKERSRALEILVRFQSEERLRHTGNTHKREQSTRSLGNDVHDHSLTPCMCRDGITFGFVGMTFQG